MPMSPAMADAWTAYERGMADIRALIFAQSWMDNPDAQAAGHYLAAQLQAVGYNLSVAPRQDFPRFFSHLYAEPTSYCWGMKTPDFLTRYGFFDGARTYRIWGRRKTSDWLEFSVYGRYITGPMEEVSHLGTYDFDDLQVGTDGAFEIIASAREHPGAWIRLDPASDNNVIHLRELFTDWEGQETLELHVEPLGDDPPRPLLYSEAEMIRRLEGAVRMARAIVETMVIGVAAKFLPTLGTNAFFVDDMDARLGTNPRARYLNGLYEIGRDEALIIEANLSKPRYWSLLIGDAWMQALDYLNHQSSLSLTQARVDADGLTRIVLSARDPGVQNWVEAIGGTFGWMLLRWYFGGDAIPPRVTRVPFDQVRDYLAPDTPTISPAERAAGLQTRRRAGLKRYDY